MPEDAASAPGAPGAPDDRTRASALPDVLDLPYELLDSAGEAFRTRRSDVVGVLAAHHTGEVIADGRPVADAQVPGMLGALAAETRGRLRALVCEVPAETVGVTSWLLVADGWRALRPTPPAASPGWSCGGWTRTTSPPASPRSWRRSCDERRRPRPGARRGSRPVRRAHTTPVSAVAPAGEGTTG